MKKVLLVVFMSIFTAHIDCMPPELKKHSIQLVNTANGSIMARTGNGQVVDLQGLYVVTAWVREKKDTTPLEDRLKALEKAIYKHTVLTELVSAQIDRIEQTQQTEKRKDEFINQQLSRLVASSKNIETLYHHCTKELSEAELKEFKEIQDIFKDAADTRRSFIKILNS